MARSLKNNSEAAGLAQLPTRDYTCRHKGCKARAAWFGLFKAWPDLPNQQTYQPLIGELGIQFCDEHKDENVSKVLADMIARVKRLVREHGLADIDEKTARIEIRPMSEATIK